MPAAPAPSSRAIDVGAGNVVDPLSLRWLVIARWITVLAAIGAVTAGERALDVAIPFVQAGAIIAAIAGTNLALWWRVRLRRPTSPRTAAGLLCVDVVLLSILLSRSGGVLNPASIFFVVQIVLAALVLGRFWAWLVTALAVTGYAALFVAPDASLRTAQVMHPEIALHMRGMWIAFGATALAVAFLVTRLVLAIERRDRALADLRDRAARHARADSLATAVAGAAHELGSPLATMAVASRELERSLAALGGNAEMIADAQLIRAQADRCRTVLDQMTGRISAAAAESPAATTVAEVLASMLAELGPADRARVATTVPEDIRVNWPRGVVSQALLNLVQNGLQTSPDDATVQVRADASSDQVRIAVIDRGAGMPPHVLQHAGEPFFTTKPAGQGMGLGLFVARSSIEALRGYLKIDSHVQAGTTVTIVLPRDVVAILTQ